MKDGKFNAGSECINITLCGIPSADGFEWTVSGVNIDELSDVDWHVIFNCLQQLKGCD